MKISLEKHLQTRSLEKHMQPRRICLEKQEQARGSCMDGAACLVFKTVYFCETKNNQTLSLTFYIVCGVYGLNMQPLKCRPYTNGLEKPKKHQALLRLQRKSTNKPKQFQLYFVCCSMQPQECLVQWLEKATDACSNRLFQACCCVCASFFHVSHVQCTVYSQLVQAVFLKV